MKKLSNLVLYCTILLGLTSCESTRTAGEYLSRPDYSQCITAFETGYMFCNGVKVKIPPGMQVTETAIESEIMIDYCSDIEFRLFKCLKFGGCK